MQSFKEYTEKNRSSIFSAIDQYIPTIKPRAFDYIVRDYPHRQGNYRRPALLLLTCEMLGGDFTKALLPAAAIQLSEDWILIEDDIEDHSEMRRGKKTLHKLFGLENAVNASHFLHMTVWKMLGDYVISQRTSEASQIHAMFYDLFVHLREAQYKECEFTYNTRSFKKASKRLYFEIIDSKTGYYSVYGPMQMGAILAKRNDLVDVLGLMGKYAGRAFQISDDVLDFIGNEKVFGKQRYGDLYEGKLSLIMLHAYSKSTPQERVLIDRVYGKNREDKKTEDIDELASLVNKYRSIEFASAEGDRNMKRALGILKRHEPKFPNNELFETFKNAIRELYNRRQ